MSELAEYAPRYQHARLTRDEKGVLEVALHTDGGPLVWSESAHRELAYLFADIGTDAQNRVVILTGTGDAFCADIAGEAWAAMHPSALQEKIYLEGKRLLDNLLNIDKLYLFEALVFDGDGVSSHGQFGNTIVSASIRNRLTPQSGRIFDNRDMCLRQQTARRVRDRAAQSAAVHLGGAKTGERKQNGKSN